MDQQLDSAADDAPPSAGLRSTRRTLMAGAGALTAAALVGCEKYGGSSDNDTAEAPAPGEALTPKADVPEGGGIVLEDAQVVVTQPSAGTFKCFSAICTHEGCQVTSVESGTINCPCHGSKFDLNGQLVQGPATAPLTAEKISDQGDNIALA